MNTEKSLGASVRRLWPLGALAVVGLVVALAMPRATRSEAASAAPSIGAAKPVPKGMAVATLSGGCFWSMEAMYKRLKGVQSAEPGYSGGKTKNPTYEEVGSGATGHAESANIIYDPKVISYSDLVEVLLTVLDPTTPNQQGADVGTNYRSIIFYRTPQEKKEALAVIKKVQASGQWKAPIVTEVKAFQKFYPAEAYHQNYYDLHPNLGYCKAVILPKLEKLQAHFASEMK